MPAFVTQMLGIEILCLRIRLTGSSLLRGAGTLSTSRMTLGSTQKCTARGEVVVLYSAFSTSLGTSACVTTTALTAI